MNGFGFTSYFVVAGSQITRVCHRETKLETFASFSLEEELLPPAGKELNCSDGSKPGWSSHWGSVPGFNVSVECALSGIKKKKKTDRKAAEA